MLLTLPGCNRTPQPTAVDPAPATSTPIAVAMPDADLLAQGWCIVKSGGCNDRHTAYRFIMSPGPAGQPAPACMPPGQKPQPPCRELVLPPAPPAPAPAAG